MMNVELNETEEVIVEINRLVNKINANFDAFSKERISARFDNIILGYEVALSGYDDNKKFQFLFQKQDMKSLDELKEAYNELKELAEKKGLI